LSLFNFNLRILRIKVYNALTLLAIPQIVHFRFFCLLPSRPPHQILATPLRTAGLPGLLSYENVTHFVADMVWPISTCGRYCLWPISSFPRQSTQGK